MRRVGLTESTAVPTKIQSIEPKGTNIHGEDGKKKQKYKDKVYLFMYHVFAIHSQVVSLFAWQFWKLFVWLASSSSFPLPQPSLHRVYTLVRRA